MASELSRAQVFKALRTEYGPNRTVKHSLVECVLATDYAFIESTLEAVKQAIRGEFAKKDYTGADRQHDDVLENLGTFLDHHQEVEKQCTALRQQLAEAERQRDAHADLACEWRRELGALRQQLEQSQQLVTDGQEAIGHWQGEYEQLRQCVQELETPLCIGQPTIEILATTGEYIWEGRGLIAADDLFHHSPYQHLATAQARILELEQDDYKKQAEALADAIDQMKVSYQHQLAAAQAKIVELTDALESGFMKGAYARLSELQHKEQKLYEAEARIRELEAHLYIPRA